ncbi:hypothetical protein LB506_010496 [Fusarium annulatum]|nr:hypothetical protein LB506_010496 [Fusarium annulatum]
MGSSLSPESVLPMEEPAIPTAPRYFCTLAKLETCTQVFDNVVDTWLTMVFAASHPEHFDCVIKPRSLAAEALVNSDSE